MRTYYKLISGGAVVDAVCSEDAVWIEENPRTHALFAGQMEFASGVGASDGSTTWHIAGRPVFTDFPGYATVELYEISGAEYEAIMADIEAERMKEEDFVPEDEVPDSGNAKTKLQLLEERIAALQAENEMLIECLLEMSEIVYG